MRIALDGMGGDHAPSTTVGGAMLAVSRDLCTPGQIVFTGRPDELLAALAEHDAQGVVVSSPDELPPTEGDRFGIVPATEIVGMHESPSVALRQKRDSSLLVAARLVKEGVAQALLSAGNTGACVAAAMFNLRLLEHVHRPGIAVTIAGAKGPFTLIDVGANVVPKPVHLFQYGVMGACQFRRLYGKDDPTVGLVNIGGEEGKGNELAKETQALFRNAPFNFVGNVEGQEVFHGAADVLVCEGFVGNVTLKLSEGLASYLLRVVREELVKAGVRPEVLQTGLQRIIERTDYAEYGGASLLGVEGIVTICHGRSDEVAIANALRVSFESIEAAVNETIADELSRIPHAEVSSRRAGG